MLGIAKALQCMHRMYAVHRDVTPYNVLVMADGTLKLGDFGIAKHLTYGPGVVNDVFNPGFVPDSVLQANARFWKRQLDTYQLGQLLVMLLSGEPWRHSTRDVAQLTCSEPTSR